MAWKSMSDIEYYYSAKYSTEVEGFCANHGLWLPVYHQFGFDHLRAPVITSREPERIQMFSWGLIPHKISDLKDALSIRGKTLMCRSEDMYDKYSFQDLARAGKRCIIPTSGYFEHHWVDDKGKVKIPYYLTLKHRPFFSLGGLYSRWIDKNNNREYYTYSVCTTEANALAGAIHNQGQRMPVILANKAAEKAWLNTTTSKDEVLDLCRPIDSSMMQAHPVSRLITSKNNNVPEAIEPYAYPSAVNLVPLHFN